MVESEFRVRVHFFNHKIQITINETRQSDKSNESGKEAQKDTMRLIDFGLPQSKNKVNSNSKGRIESKIQ